MEYTVYCLFREAGRLDVRQCGLYYEYRGTVYPESTEYLRLYFHSRAGSLRLGLFREQTICGKISVRSLGCAPGEGIFSLTEEPWLPWKTENTLACLRDGHWEIIGKREKFPEEFLPYCCFVYPAEHLGQKLLRLDFSEDGIPIMPRGEPRCTV